MRPRDTILAIETSQRVGGVALRTAAGKVEVEMLASGGRHEDDLLAAIDRLVGRQGARPADLSAVGVSVGPGGFTGLRIAVSVAKMLAEVLEVSLVAIPSALVVAEAHAMATADPGPILVALAVKRGSFWATRLRPAAGGYHIEGEPALATAENLDLAGLQALIGDEHLPEDVHQRCLDAGLPVIEPRFDPAAALQVTVRRLAEGDTVDSLHLLPIYARPPEAVTIWEQRRKGHPPVQ